MVQRVRVLDEKRVLVPNHDYDMRVGKKRPAEVQANKPTE